MPRFEPFDGLRYDLTRLADDGVALDDVIAPPYDVIDPPARAELGQRSEWNAVHLEVPEDDPGTARDRYQVAADLLAAWREAGLVRPEGRPALYLYQMSFEDPGGHDRRTCGVLGALEALPPGEGDVLPHERTTPKPKGDRLDLLRACRTNLSPVWGLSMATGLAALCRPTGPPAAAARDADGVYHELWPVTDPEAIAAISTRVASAPVVLADGHHRYETALAYAREQRARHGGAGGAYDLTMALVVELAEDELAVGPIHRLVGGLADGLDPVAAFGSRFELRPADPALAAGTASAATVPGLLAAADAPALLTPSGAWYLEAKPETRKEADDDLDSSRLDLVLADLPPHELSFHHDPEEVLAAVAAGRAQAGVLVRPAPVAAIARAANEGRRLPAKTTFFTPKPRTGMVFRPLCTSSTPADPEPTAREST
ncbi:MAG TPA: DUF1015 domain-containing protein [Acidimicrobiales bacterium]|nr:DUF1015 domain-containing protein [Acidimicrobiales bacterium]